MGDTHLRLNRHDEAIVERANALLDRMTLDEKVGQMNQLDPRWNPEIEQRVREGKVGSVLSVRSTSQINRLQHVAVEETRLDGAFAVTGM